MRTIVSENRVLTKFYVAVLYKNHKFIPSEGTEISENLKEEIIKDGTFVKKLFFSSSSISDLIEFAEYKFKFKIDGDRKEYLLNNFLNEASRELVGTQFRDLQKIEHIVVPQVCGEMSDWDEKEDGFFGGISLDNTRISLVDVPENIWKIEIYQEDQESFIEYSIRKLFGLEIKEKPLLTIELGPDPVDNYSMNSNDMYYIVPELDIKKEAQNKDYKSLLLEISDRKVFYIVQSPNDIYTVNISLSSWNSAKIPHRNKKYWNVTNNYFNGKVQDDESTFTTEYNNTLIDTNSMTLLGNIKRDIPSFLKEKIERAKNTNKTHTFKETVVYNEGDEVVYKGNKYKSLISGNIWDRPSISGNWTKIDEGKTILDKIEKNKIYIPITVISSGGNVYPSGNLSARTTNSGSWYKTFTIEEPLGYVFSSILIDYSYKIDKESLSSYISRRSDGTYTFSFDQEILKNKFTETAKLPYKNIEFVFDKLIPTLNVNFIVSHDYYYSDLGPTKTYINEFPKGIKIKLNGEELDSIYGGISLSPGSKYEIEVLCDNEYYTLSKEVLYNGIIEDNIVNINVPVDPREYRCILTGYRENGITVNGDSSKICYYGQDCVIEFCFERDEDVKENWRIKNNMLVNGEEFVDDPKYLITLTGGGNIQGEIENNYILTIKNVNQDFNIEILDLGGSKDEN